MRAAFGACCSLATSCPAGGICDTVSSSLNGRAVLPLPAATSSLCWFFTRTPFQHQPTQPVRYTTFLLPIVLNAQSVDAYEKGRRIPRGMRLPFSYASDN